MAATIKKQTGVEAELIVGDRGIFDVVLDDELIFSKFAADRFPNDQEILASLKARE